MALIDSPPASASAAAHPGEDARTADRIAYVLTFGSAAAIMASIAASQILMGLALLVCLISRRRLRFPSFCRPLLLFMAITIVADLLSPDPGAGLPQIRKFYVFAVIPLIYTFFRNTQRIAILVITWASIASAAALVGLHQFAARFAEAQRLHWNIYEYVLDKRMTGFAGHWMTFGGEQMIAALMLASLLMFGPRSRWKALGLIGCALIVISLVLGMTRSVYLAGLPAGMMWLAWRRARTAAIVIPLVLVAAFVSVPGHVRERMSSVFHPHGNVDSNGRRVIMVRTGLAMIRSHPWFGIGPEQPGRQFASYVPPDVKRPLPKGWYGHLHNIYIQYAAERGIPALLTLLWAIAAALIESAGGGQGSHGRWIRQAAIAVIVAVLVEGLFEHNLGDSEVLTMFLTVLSVSSAAAPEGSAGTCA